MPEYTDIAIALLVVLAVYAYGKFAVMLGRFLTGNPRDLDLPPQTLIDRAGIKECGHRFESIRIEGGVIDRCWKCLETKAYEI